MTLPIDRPASGLAVTVTGTRTLDGPISGLDSVFEDYLRPFTGPDAHFFVGGAIGIDTAALEWLADGTESRITVVVPCTISDQPDDAGEAITRWRGRDRLARVVELGAATLGTVAYHARNRWMVDRSTLTIGFPRGTTRASGTWYTLNYAAEQGKPRMIVPL